MMSLADSFKWGKYTPLYKKDIKETQNKPIETTNVRYFSFKDFTLTHYSFLPRQLGQIIRSAKSIQKDSAVVAEWSKTLVL